MIALGHLCTNAQIGKSVFIPSKQNIPFKIIIAELKGMPGCFDAYYKVLTQQSTEFPYVLVLEKDASFCFFMNLYVSASDTTVLKYVHLSGLEEENFYKKVYTLNKERDFRNKITFRSFDIEHHNNFRTCLNAIYYMISNVSNSTIQQIADSTYYNSNIATHLKATSLLRLIDSTRLAYLIPYDSVLQEIKNNLNNSISFSTPYSNSWYKKREKKLVELFNKATFNTSRYCVITQVTHMPKSDNRKAFLKKIELSKLGIIPIYPIYFNRYSNTNYKKSFYCTHPKNPFLFYPKNAREFSSKKGTWLISNKDNYYLIVSN